MNCAVHTETPATAYCRTCGTALCHACKRDVRGVIYCENCLAARVGDPAVAAGTASGMTPAYVAPTGEQASPGLAAILGFIPGVGAMYNGQFAKGFIHVVIFAMIIWATDQVSEFFGFLIAFWVFYMVFDAYKTAKARQLGQPLPDPFGINEFSGTMPRSWAEANQFPIGAVVLIGLGCLFLLQNFHIVNLHYVARLWPLVLIYFGIRAYMRRSQGTY